MNGFNEQLLDGSITICKKEIAVKTGYFRQDRLSFFPENPRIYSILNAEEEEPSQSVIQERLELMDHVRQLVQEISANGGLTDPLIVREGDNVVLEGNSRLAAYRILARKDPIKWGMVKCTFLPNEISEDEIFTLLGQYHIIGKKDWAPFEQAGYLYRRKMMHKVDEETMAKEMGLTKTYIQKLIEVYSFMVENKDTEMSRWSYYDEFIKSRVIGHAREEFKEFDKVVVDKIQSGEISKAIEIREKLQPIVKAGGKTLRTFIEKRGSFERCYERAISRGAGNQWLQRLKKFRSQIGEIKSELGEMNEDHRDKCLFEMKKIKAALDAVLRLKKFSRLDEGQEKQGGGETIE